MTASVGSVYTEKMADFSRFLRSRGLSAGLKETEDACRLLQDFDLSERETVRGLLKAVYAKSLKEQEIFDRCFDRFFISRELKQELQKKEAAEAEEYEARRKQAEEDLTYNGQPMDFTEVQKDIYIRMSEEVRSKLRDYKDQFKDSIDRNPQLYGNFIHSVFMRSILEQQMLMEDAAAHTESFDSPELDLMYRSISTFTAKETRQAAALIEQIGARIDAQLKQKKRISGKSSAIDFRKTIRKSLETGGVPMTPVYRKKHPDRKRLVLLLDVSASMLQFSEFALLFIRSLSEISQYSRTFIFSEELAELEDIPLTNDDNFRDYVRSTGLYGRGTNLAESLKELLAVRPQVLNSHTALVILSDAKTVEAENASYLLKEASRLSGDILWLNPIQKNKWSYLQTVQLMASMVRMLPASTLAELTEACRTLTADR